MKSAADGRGAVRVTTLAPVVATATPVPQTTAVKRRTALIAAVVAGACAPSPSVAPTAVAPTVRSNGAWTGSCWAAENSGTASTIRVSDSRLEWHLSGGSGWSALGATPDTGCFANRPVGSTTYGFDYRLRVLWTDEPGTVCTSVHYGVSP